MLTFIFKSNSILPLSCCSLQFTGRLNKATSVLDLNVGCYSQFEILLCLGLSKDRFMHACTVSICAVLIVFLGVFIQRNIQLCRSNFYGSKVAICAKLNDCYSCVFSFVLNLFFLHVQSQHVLFSIICQVFVENSVNFIRADCSDGGEIGICCRPRAYFFSYLGQTLALFVHALNLLKFHNGNLCGFLLTHVLLVFKLLVTLVPTNLIYLFLQLNTQAMCFTFRMQNQ